MLPVLHPPGDFVSDEIRRTGVPFEAVILDELVRRVTRPGVIVDVGAHIGNHTVFFAEYLPHTAIHAFEPWADNRELLERNVARFPEVQVHPLALSDRRRQFPMMADANLGHVRAAEHPADVQQTPQAVPLDELELTDVTLLKIDVEGHEPQVLAGAALTIARSRPLILIEDWTRGTYVGLPELLPYRQAVEWPEHQTFLYEAA